MYNSKEVAEYIVSKGIKRTKQSLTNFKLQKILYYEQGFYYMVYNKPLIKEDFKLFYHGVAIQEELDRYWEYNFIEISKTGDKLEEDKISIEDKEYLDKVWGIFKNYSGKQLDYLIQDDLPKDYRNYELKPLNITEPKIISKEEIRNQFNLRYKKN